MNLLDLITRKLSRQLIIPEHIIDLVITHQWKTVKEATLTCSEIEITNLGVLKVRQKKLIKEIKKFSSILKGSISKLELSTDPNEIKKFTKRVESATAILEILKSKLKYEN